MPFLSTFAPSFVNTLLQNAGSEIDVNIVDDPTYRVAVEGVSYKEKRG